MILSELFHYGNRLSILYIKPPKPLFSIFLDFSCYEKTLDMQCTKFFRVPNFTVFMFADFVFSKLLFLKNVFSHDSF